MSSYTAQTRWPACWTRGWTPIFMTLTQEVGEEQGGAGLFIFVF